MPILYALLLALFLPWSGFWHQMDRQQRIFEQGQINSALYYVEQLRIALAHKRGQQLLQVPLVDAVRVPIEQLNLPQTVQQKEEKGITHYIDDKGFYIVWEKPPPGLAAALMGCYTRGTLHETVDNRKPLHIAFYHVGFARNHYLETIAHYPQTQGLRKRWPLPRQIKEGALVFTDQPLQ